MMQEQLVSREEVESKESHSQTEGRRGGRFFARIRGDAGRIIRFAYWKTEETNTRRRCAGHYAGSPARD